MKQLLITAVLIYSITSCAHESNVDWRADLEFLKAELPKKHYDFERLNHQHFFSELDLLSQNTDHLTDFEIALKLTQIISELGDSHTRVNAGKFINKEKILPLNLHWFKDGIYVTGATRPNSALLGQKIIAINGFPVQQVIDSLSTLMTMENAAMLKDVPNLIQYIQILEYLNLIDNSKVTFRLEDEAGDTCQYALQPEVMHRQNRIQFQPDSVALCNQNRRKFFTDHYQVNDKTYYIQYNRCWSKELEEQYGNKTQSEKFPSFEAFEKKVFNALATKDFDKIIFDLRYNRGGNSLQGTDFIEKIAAFMDQNPGKKLYVVLGRKTYSSAILNAMDFKRLTDATFVGEETSGKPNHFGEVRSFHLPSSGIRVNYSTKYFQRVDEDMNTMSPDYTIETTFEDYRNGIDPVYDWIVKHQ